MALAEYQKDCETSVRIFQDFATLHNDPTYSDVVVIVENNEFYCHQAILAAVSSFFDAAFRTDMKEAREKKITLPSIAADTFSAILNSIYRGKYILTEENMFDVWIAADLLQISFLCAQCENKCEIFCDTELTTHHCFDVLSKVRLFSDKVKQKALALICEEFRYFSVQLQIDQLELDEIKFLVSNNMLNVVTEDDVIESILRWAEGKIRIPSPENTSEACEEMIEENFLSISYQLEDLLRASRYLLISRHCLHEVLAKHKLVAANPGCQALVNEISRYQSNNHLQLTLCPPAAVPRENTKQIKLLVASIIHDQEISLFGIDLESPDEHCKKLKFPELDFDGYFQKIVHYQSRLLVISDETISMLEVSGNEWHSININRDNLQDLKSKEIICLVGNSLYLYQPCIRSVLIYRNSNFLSRNWNSFACLHSITVEISNQGEVDLKAVTTVGNTHILFLSEKAANVYTIVCVDVLRLTHKTYPHQLGSLSRFVTFHSETEVYALQENGCLWKIELGKDPLDIKLTQELLLWDGEVPLSGAVLYNNKLVILGKFPSEDGPFHDGFDLNILYNEGQIESKKVCLPGVFQDIMKLNDVLYDENCCVSRSAFLALVPSDIVETDDS